MYQAKAKSKGKGKGRHMESSIPNPYSRSSSESEEDDEEIEPDLEEVDNMRRSLRASPAVGLGKKKEPMSERAKKGWLAHQSIFPPSSSSSSETDESEKETEEESESDERVGMMGRSRRVKSKPRQEEIDVEDEDEDEADGHMLSAAELQDTRRPQVPGDYLDEPLLGPDELDQVRTGGGGNGKVPIRLQVYHGRFGHWEREGLRKYKDSGFLALWLTSIMAVLIGLLFVWGSTDVS
jgi:hypothetical protein